MIFCRKIYKKLTELESKCERLEDKLKRSNEDFVSLHRIIKHIGDEPSFEIETTREFSQIFYLSRTIKQTLYIYIDNKEYAIELDREDYVEKAEYNTRHITIEGPIAYISFETVDGMRIYFNVDYRKGTYLCEVKERKKEKED